MAKKENVVVGAAALYVSDTVGSDPAIPTWVDGTRAVVTADGATGWRNVGYTQEGIEVSYEPDYGDVEVDQLLDAARIFKQTMRVSVNTTLAESTLENLLVAWGRPDSELSGNTLNIEGGALGEAPIERELLFIGNGPEITSADANADASTYGTYRERIYNIYRAISVETTAHALRRNEPTVFSVSFRCLPNNAGRYGTVQDRIYDVTP